MKRLSPKAIAAVIVAVVALVVVVRQTGMGLAVEVATLSTDVPVRVYGLGTIEAKVSSKLGFAVAGTLVDLRADDGPDLLPYGPARLAE